MVLPSHLILPLLMITGTTANTTILKLMKVYLYTEAPTHPPQARPPLPENKSNHLRIYKKALPTYKLASDLQPIWPTIQSHVLIEDDISTLLHCDHVGPSWIGLTLDLHRYVLYYASKEMSCYLFKGLLFTLKAKIFMLDHIFIIQRYFQACEINSGYIFQ